VEPVKGLSTSEDVTRYLHRHERKEILRFVTVGSVDDGKSTLIGRLLHDTNGIYEDQLSAVRRASNMAGTEIDFSLFTDGLQAEREQGITIDVAYRYFTTERRKFIIADTPGHVQYTRNMATGASTASVAIILIDARLGVLQQSRRHAYIASLLGIPHLVVCVNKMDLRGYDPAVFEGIRKDFAAFAAKLDFKGITYIPISALRGDNIVQRSEQTPYYDGPTLLEHLETVPIGADLNLKDFRYPVQLVLRPSHEYRGYAAQIASGIVRKGDAVMVLPSRKTSRVTHIDSDGKSLDEAFAPMSVALRLADEIDVSRGDMLVHPGQAPRAEVRFDAMLVWMHERPLDRAKSYLLKHTTQTVRAEIDKVAFAIDLESLAEAPAPGLGLNDIGRVSVRTHRPLFIDAYRDNRVTGAFILIDSLTNDTVAAGMILDASAARAGDAIEASVREGHTQVSARERRERLGHGAAAVVLSGASREARRAAAFATERALFDRGCVAAVIDGIDGGGDRAVVACVEAGLVALYIPAAKEDALTSRLGEERVIRPEVDGADAERAGAAIVRAIEARGLLDLG
jgi:bifunctional enzyme CysN/CysC